VTNQKGLKNSIASLLFFFSECLKKNLSAKDVNEDLIALGLSEAKSSALADQYKRSFVALSASMIGKTLTVNELVDMEWRFGGPAPPACYLVSPFACCTLGQYLPLPSALTDCVMLSV
jgi:hypothetical protein